MVRNARDEVIATLYVEYDTPVDQVVADPAKSAYFFNHVNAHLKEGQRFDQAEFNKHLMNLRRRGEANGGLPRLRRRFNGRNGK